MESISTQHTRRTQGMVATVGIPIITATVILKMLKHNLLRKNPLLSH